MFGPFVFFEITVFLIITTVAILQIILLFKIWKMTNDVADIKELLFDKFSGRRKIIPKYTSGRYRIAIYKPRNLKVMVIEKEDEHMYKCMSVDGKSVFYFNEENLQYVDNSNAEEEKSETDNKPEQTPHDVNTDARKE